MRLFKNHYFAVLFFVIGLIFLFSKKILFTGDFIGAYTSFSGLNSLLGALLIFLSFVLFLGEESLEDILNKYVLFSVNKDSIESDREVGYLFDQKAAKEMNERCKRLKRTPIQEIIERSVNYGDLIPNECDSRSYETRFNESHASKGGRVVDLSGHVKQGKFFHYNEPANGMYIWVADEDGNLIVGNRCSKDIDKDNGNKDPYECSNKGNIKMKEGPSFLNYEKIGKDKEMQEEAKQKIPHATLARGKKVYGAGEVEFENGLVKRVNTFSGHYAPVNSTLKDNVNGVSIPNFNNQGIKVFKTLSRKIKLGEVQGGAVYVNPNFTDEKPYDKIKKEEHLEGKMFHIPSHVAPSGCKNEGRLVASDDKCNGRTYHNGKYYWVIDKDGNFLGFRTRNHGKDAFMHFLSKYPVYASGSVTFKDGLVEKVKINANSLSNDYPIGSGFENGIFQALSRKYGLKEIRGGAEYYEVYNDNDL